MQIYVRNLQNEILHHTNIIDPLKSRVWKSYYIIKGI